MMKFAAASTGNKVSGEKLGIYGNLMMYMFGFMIVGVCIYCMFKTMTDMQAKQADKDFFD